MANIQIPEELFIELCKYHLLGIEDVKTANIIRKGLNTKYEAIRKRIEYSERLKNDHK